MGAWPTGPRYGAAAAKLIARRENAPDRRDERLAKIAEIAKGNTALGTSTRYPIIYADPPWRYEIRRWAAATALSKTTIRP